ncbi:hypothetical protein VTK26DRAFT_4990 [Humicola hyalothermophila]
MFLVHVLPNGIRAPASSCGIGGVTVGNRALIGMKFEMSIGCAFVSSWDEKRQVNEEQFESLLEESPKPDIRSRYGVSFHSISFGLFYPTLVSRKRVVNLPNFPIFGAGRFANYTSLASRGSLQDGSWTSCLARCGRDGPTVVGPVGQRIK